MEYTTLGSTGMSVSRICVGCGRLGRDDETRMDGQEATAFIDRAIDLGINFFDTANIYSDGQSEEILGTRLAEYDRDRFVVATKVWGDMNPSNPNASGLSRKAIEQELANSLERLGMETVDLYQIHRWDYDTPIAETLRALDDAIRRGQVRYIGASSMWAHQFARALHTSDRLGLARFVSMQNYYNLAYREEEREMLPLCELEGIGVIPWSPLAKGFLARPESRLDGTARGQRIRDSSRVAAARSNGGRAINSRLEEVAEDHGISMAQVALAWLLERGGVDAPVVGMSSIGQLEEAAAATELSIPADDYEYLEEPYEPTRVEGHE